MKIKKEFLEWGIIIGVMVTLYATGLHTEVIGKVQSLLVVSGALQPEIDEPMPNDVKADYRLSYTDKSGAVHTLAEHEGKTIFLNFWATWCPPCIAEMPDINRLHGAVGNDVVFVMVSLDKEASKAWDFSERKGYGFPVYRLAGGIPSVFASPSIPTTYVVSPNGTIAMKRAGMAKYNSDKFKEFLLSL